MSKSNTNFQEEQTKKMEVLDEKYQTQKKHCCTTEDMHPFNCDTPYGGYCIHCERKILENHDPATCALCNPEYDHAPNPYWKKCSCKENEGCSNCPPKINTCEECEEQTEDGQKLCRACKSCEMETMMDDDSDKEEDQIDDYSDDDVLAN